MEKEKLGPALTGHNSEAIKSLALEIGDDFVRPALLIGSPILNNVQNIDSRWVLSSDSIMLVVAKHGFIHSGEIDDGDSEGAVHVEDDSPEAAAGRDGGGEIGHGSGE